MDINIALSLLHALNRDGVSEEWSEQWSKIVDEFERLQRCEERVAELEDALEKCKRGDE